MRNVDQKRCINGGPKAALAIVEAIRSLTPADRAALETCAKSDNPTVRLNVVGGAVSHYRWFRLVEKGLGKNIPPRLTSETIAALKCEAEVSA